MAVTKDGVVSSPSIEYLALAECAGPECGWTEEEQGTGSRNRVNARARRHVIATGHEIRMERTRITILRRA